jgi:SAM-dependent methyltransferase
MLRPTDEGIHKMTNRFSPDIYRNYNLDLRHLTDSELLEHFHKYPHERRIYGNTSTTIETLSMRWLRGNGIEVGAGANPTPLFGDARARLSDCDETLAFGGNRIDVQYSIDDPEFSRQNRARYDFAIASHVLEHADSFLRAVENLLLITRAGGVVYIVLPDINFLLDKNWLPNFDFEHHITEYHKPLTHANLHDRLYISGSGEGILHTNQVAHLSKKYQAAVLSGHIPADQRFLHHKHNYGFNDWLGILHLTQGFFRGKFAFLDVRYGHERSDCHFVLGVSPPD